MADSNAEPLCKTAKRDNSKSVDTREDAKKIMDDFGVFVQVGDKICSKYCTKLRLQKCIVRRQEESHLENVKVQEEAPIPIAELPSIGHQEDQNEHGEG